MGFLFLSLHTCIPLDQSTAGAEPIVPPPRARLGPCCTRPSVGQYHISLGASPNAACRPPRTPFDAAAAAAAAGSSGEFAAAATAEDEVPAAAPPDLRAARAALMSSIELIEARSSALGMSAVKSDW